MRKLLAVSWAMPPMLYPRSIQVARVLAVLAKLGWEITVICNDPQSSSGNDETLSSLYDSNYRKINVLPNTSIQADALMSPWLEPGLQAARTEIASNEYFALITFAQPWVDHLIGLKLHTETRIPWVAHFSDPWVDNPYYSSIDGKQIKRWMSIEREVVRRASAIIFTNSYAMDLVMRKYPSDWKRKSYVVPHAFDTELVRKLNVKRPTMDRRLRMTYTGDLYAERSAGCLLKALDALSKQRPLADELNVQFIGRITASELNLAQELSLGSVVDFHDQLPYVSSLQASALCDVLLLIDAPSSKPNPFLPSKLVDYLMFKKPIFGLTSSKGASADLLRRLGSIIVSPDDIPAIIKAMDNLLNQWRNGSVKPADHFEDVASDYHLQKVGLAFDQILSTAIDPAPVKFWWQRMLLL